jgi:dephospho-CoA kinase
MAGREQKICECVARSRETRHREIENSNMGNEKTSGKARSAAQQGGERRSYDTTVGGRKPRLVGLTGTNSAGKGEVAAYLKSRGYVFHSLSDVLREELAERGLETSRDNLIRVGNELRAACGADILARRIMDRLAAGPAVIDSIRNTREVEFFRGTGDFVLLAVDAPIELRFERARARGRNESAATLEEFRAKEQAEMDGGEGRQQLRECMAMADRLIVNDGSLDDLRRKVETALEEPAT